MEILLASDIFLFIMAAIALIFATVTDIRKTEVPNWLSFSLLTSAFAIRLIASIISLQFNYVLYGIGAFVIFFILANIFFYGKFFGGGDAKLLMALAVVFATTPSFFPSSSTLFIEEPFLLSFFINIFVIGAFYSLAFVAYFSTRNRESFKIEFKKVYRKMKITRIIFMIISILILALAFFSVMFEFAGFWSFIILAFALFIFPYLYIIAKATETSSMIRKVSSKDLTEGDWLVERVHIGKKIIKPSIHGLNTQDIKLLRKSRKKVLIKYGIPFVPVFLISLIITSLLGNLIILIIRTFLF